MVSLCRSEPCSSGLKYAGCRQIDDEIQTSNSKSSFFSPDFCQVGMCDGQDDDDDEDNDYSDEEGGDEGNEGHDQEDKEHRVRALAFIHGSQESQAGEQPAGIHGVAKSSESSCIPHPIISQALAHSLVRCFHDKGATGAMHHCTNERSSAAALTADSHHHSQHQVSILGGFNSQHQVAAAHASSSTSGKLPRRGRNSNGKSCYPPGSPCTNTRSVSAPPKGSIAFVACPDRSSISTNQPSIVMAASTVGSELHHQEWVQAQIFRGSNSSGVSHASPYSFAQHQTTQRVCSKQSLVPSGIFTPPPMHVKDPSYPARASVLHSPAASEVIRTVAGNEHKDKETYTTVRDACGSLGGQQLDDLPSFMPF